MVTTLGEGNLSASSQAWAWHVPSWGTDSKVFKTVPAASLVSWSTWEEQEDVNLSICFLLHCYITRDVRFRSSHLTQYFLTQLMQCLIPYIYQIQLTAITMSEVTWTPVVSVWNTGTNKLVGLQFKMEIWFPQIYSRWSSLLPLQHD